MSYFFVNGWYPYVVVTLNAIKRSNSVFMEFVSFYLLFLDLSHGIMIITYLQLKCGDDDFIWYLIVLF